MHFSQCSVLFSGTGQNYFETLFEILSFRPVATDIATDKDYDVIYISCVDFFTVNPVVRSRGADCVSFC